VRLGLDSILVIPAAIVGAGGWHGVAEVMRPRLGKQTFHTMLDTSGVHFLGVEEIIHSVNRASLHMATSLVRTMDAYRGFPGAGTLRQIAVGTTKILQHSDGVVLLGDPIARQLVAIQNLPSIKILSGISETGTNVFGPLPMGIAAQARVFLTVSSVMSLNLRLLRRSLLKITRATNVQGVILGIGISVLYESKDDFDSFLDSTGEKASTPGVGPLARRAT